MDASEFIELFIQDINNDLLQFEEFIKISGLCNEKSSYKIWEHNYLKWKRDKKLKVSDIDIYLNDD